MCGEMNHRPSYQQGTLVKCYVTSLDVNFPLSASKQCPTVHADFSHTHKYAGSTRLVSVSDVRNSF